MQEKLAAARVHGQQSMHHVGMAAPAGLLVTRRLSGVIWIGSGNFPRVK